MEGRTAKLVAAQRLAKQLDEGVARELERLLLAEYDDEAIALLRSAVPTLPDGFDLADATCRNHLLDFLDPLLMPSTEDGEDIEDMQTIAMPNYENFARDLRDSDE